MDKPVQIFYSGFIATKFTIPTPDNPRGVFFQGHLKNVDMPIWGAPDVFREALGDDVVELWQKLPGHFPLHADMEIEVEDGVGRILRVLKD